MENPIQVNTVSTNQGQSVMVKKPRVDPSLKPSSGVQKKKGKKKSNREPSKLKDLKELRLLPAVKLDANPAENERSTLDEKLDEINMLPHGKEDLRNTLEDNERVKALTNELTNWLMGNNSKTLEILNVFRKLGKKECLTYSQFIGTLINVEAPFRIKDLCTLVIHLSSQKAGLIAERDIEKLLKKTEPTECDICGLGKLVQTNTGPFGINQVSLNLPKMLENKDKPQDNKWVQFLANSFVKKDKTINFDSKKNIHFKSAFINWSKQKDRFDKPAIKNEPAVQKEVFSSIAKKTMRTREILSDWRKTTSKTEMSGENEVNNRLFKRSHSRKRLSERKIKNNSGSEPQSDLPEHIENAGGLSRTTTRNKNPTCWHTNGEERRVRFKNISTKVAGDIKKKNVPSILGVYEKTREKLMSKKKHPRPKCQRLSFLTLPEEDDDLLTIFAQTQKKPVEFFVLLQLRSIIYNTVLSCPAHFPLLLNSDTALNYVAHRIKEVNDISRADVYISPYINSLRQSLLPQDSTLKQCGYRGYCQSHPQKVTLYYDFDIIYSF